MKKIARSILFLTFVGVSSFAAAAPEGKPGSGPNPFVDCGIGAALFPDTHWAAVTSNVIWDLGSTAVTSATVSPETCSGKSVKAALFIRDTYTQLVEDTSKGHGKHINTALSLMDCTNANQQESAIKMVRSSMSEQVSYADYQTKSAIQKSSDLYEVISRAAKTACTV